jgi:YggT family protein
MGILALAVSRFCDLLMLLLLGRAVLSWFVNPYNYHSRGALHKLNSLLTQLTEPVVAPCRKLLSNFNTGIFDFSILVAILAITLIRRLLLMILQMIAV